MRHLILTIITISMVFASTAQLTMKRTGLGIHAGVNTTNIWYLDDNVVEISPDHDPMPGYQVGIRYNIKLGPIGFCPELNFTSITTGMESTIDGETASNTTTFNYVSAPLLLKLYMWGFNIQLGGQLSTLIGGSNEATIGQTSQTYDLKDDIFYDTVDGTEYWMFQELDLAAVVGFGIDTKMGIYGSCRAIMSLVPTNNILYQNALNNTLGIPDLDADAINAMNKWMSVQFSLGYKF